jgi:hypothetical protein
VKGIHGTSDVCSTCMVALFALGMRIASGLHLCVFAVFAVFGCGWVEDEVSNLTRRTAVGLFVKAGAAHANRPLPRLRNRVWAGSRLAGGR